MNEVQIFEHEAFGEIRTVLIDGEPWFVGKDVAAALGYSNTRDALARHVDIEDKNTVVIHDGIQGNPNQTVINESGMYSLILSSKLPGAKAFKRWVTSEVLPTIRKTKAFFMDDDALLRHFVPNVNEESLIFMRAQLNIARELTTQIAQNQPLVDFAHHVMETDNYISINTMAKLAADEGIPIGSVRLFKWLRRHRILMDNNLPYQEYIDRGYFKVKETPYERCGKKMVYQKTVVTGKGQQYLINRLRDEFLGV